MKSRQLQTGSAHIVIIIVLVVAVLGLLGFVFWQNFINKPVESTSQAQTSDYTNEKVFVSNFYTQFVALGSGTNGVDAQKETDLMTKYMVTSSNNGGSFDAVLCAQNFPQTIKIDNGTKNKDGIAFDIEEVWSGQNPTHVTATVSSHSEGMRITIAQCSL